MSSSKKSSKKASSSRKSKAAVETSAVAAAAEVASPSSSPMVSVGGKKIPVATYCENAWKNGSTLKHVVKALKAFVAIGKYAVKVGDDKAMSAMLESAQKATCASDSIGFCTTENFMSLGKISPKQRLGTHEGRAVHALLTAVDVAEGAATGKDGPATPKSVAMNHALTVALCEAVCKSDALENAIKAKFANDGNSARQTVHVSTFLSKPDSAKTLIELADAVEKVRGRVVEQKAAYEEARDEAKKSKKKAASKEENAQRLKESSAAHTAHDNAMRELVDKLLVKECMDTGIDADGLRKAYKALSPENTALLRHVAGDKKQWSLFVKDAASCINIKCRLRVTKKYIGDVEYISHLLCFKLGDVHYDISFSADDIHLCTNSDDGLSPASSGIMFMPGLLSIFDASSILSCLDGAFPGIAPDNRRKQALVGGVEIPSKCTCEKTRDDFHDCTATAIHAHNKKNSAKMIGPLQVNSGLVAPLSRSIQPALALLYFFFTCTVPKNTDKKRSFVDLAERVCSLWLYAANVQKQDKVVAKTGKMKRAHAAYLSAHLQKLAMPGASTAALHNLVCAKDDDITPRAAFPVDPNHELKVALFREKLWAEESTAADKDADKKKKDKPAKKPVKDKPAPASSSSSSSSSSSQPDKADDDDDDDDDDDGKDADVGEGGTDVSEGESDGSSDDDDDDDDDRKPAVQASAKPTAAKDTDKSSAAASSSSSSSAAQPALSKPAPVPSRRLVDDDSDASSSSSEDEAELSAKQPASKPAPATKKSVELIVPSDDEDDGTRVISRGPSASSGKMAVEPAKKKKVDKKPAESETDGSDADDDDDDKDKKAVEPAKKKKQTGKKRKAESESDVSDAEEDKKKKKMPKKKPASKTARTGRETDE